jgi:hypothetical protein
MIRAKPGTAKTRNMASGADSAFRDVLADPRDHLWRSDGFVCLGVRYEKCWDDGFGARGWKLNSTIGDPEIIASTRETGQRIPTSVFVHDILDHCLSGFGVSGHRSEAMALMQLHARTGSDPRPDYEQMVREDIINGRVNGESLPSFLPQALRDNLPADRRMTNRDIMAGLKASYGEARLVDLLVEHFFALGRSGESHATRSWRKLGLDPNRRTQIGLALQAVLAQADRAVEAAGIEALDAQIDIGGSECVLRLSGGLSVQQEYRATIDAQR